MKTRLKNEAELENFHSREGALNLVYDEVERVQYDGKDDERLAKIAEGLTLSAMSLISAMGAYRDAVQNPDQMSEDSVADVKEARAELCEAWTYAQMALSKVAWGIRLDGNEAYAKLINSQLNSTYPLNFKGM